MVTLAAKASVLVDLSRITEVGTPDLLNRFLREADGSPDPDCGVTESLARPPCRFAPYGQASKVSVSVLRLDS